MHILVAVKRVVDYRVRIQVREGRVQTANTKMSMNPFDEIALEEALRLKEAGHVRQVTALSIGPAASQEVLRHALALGADDAYHVLSDEEHPPLHVAKILAKIAAQECFDAIFLGKQAIDDDCNQTGQMLAALLDWPCAAFASKVTHQEGVFTVVREIDAGLETLELRSPCVITADLRLNTPRYASLPNIMKAKQKPLKEIALSSLGLELCQHLSVLEVFEPLPRKAGILVSDVSTLVDKLRSEARVIE